MIVALAAGVPQPGAAQRQVGLERSKSLVARIHAPIPIGVQVEETNGTGIVLGLLGDTLLLVSACHVVYSEHDCREPRNDIRVWLRDDTARAGRSASVIEFDRNAFHWDIAYLYVPGVRQLKIPRDFPFRRVRNGASLDERTAIYPIGCVMQLACWDLPLEPGRIAAADSHAIQVRIGGPRSGYSGGGLFTRDGELVGIMISESPEATDLAGLPIEAVIEHAKSLGLRVPVLLQKPPTPLRGYLTKLAIAPVLRVAGVPSADEEITPDVDSESTEGGQIEYIMMAGLRGEGSWRLSRGLYGTAGTDVSVSRQLRVSSVFAGAEVELLTWYEREPDPLASFFFIQLVGARMFTQRAVGSYTHGEESYAVTAPESVLAVGPRAGLTLEALIREHFLLRTSVATSLYPLARSGYPKQMLEIAIQIAYAP